MTKQEFKQLLKDKNTNMKEFAATYDIPYDSVRGYSRKTRICALKLQGGKK